MSAVRVRFAALALVATAVAACSPDRAVSRDPLGDPAYGVQLVLSPTNLPRGTARIPDPVATDVPPTTTLADTISLSIQGLDSLENGAYVVWLADSLGTSIVKATGTLTAIVTDTVLDAFGDPVAASDTTVYTNVSSFTNGGPRHAFEFRTSRAQSGMAADDPVQAVFLSIESDPAATTPAEMPRPLWAFRAGGTSVRRIADIDTVATTPAVVTDTTFDRRYRQSNLVFGNFAFDAVNRYVYVPQGRGRAYVRGEIFLINDSSLTRPPQGYFYAAYAIELDVDNNIVDTLYLGPQTSPFPRRDISLRDADVQIVDPLVQTTIPPQILAASVRVDADTVAGLTGVNPYEGFAEVFVTLESKNAVDARMGPAILLRAALPEIVRFPE